jgi:FkbM family methyltransferase
MTRDIDLIFSVRESRSIPYMVSPGETVVVCGVWQKGTIMRYASTIGASGKLVFVEANEDNVQHLSRMTAAMPWVTWVNKAVWSETADLSFVRSLGDRHSWDRVLDDKAEGNFPYHKVDKHEVITIQADTIDNILSDLDIDRIDHLNLTVNRCEFEALEGARGIIKSSPDMRLRLPTRQGEFVRMRSLLKGMGFTVHSSGLPKEWTNGSKRKRYRIYAVKG